MKNRIVQAAAAALLVFGAASAASAQKVEKAPPAKEKQENRPVQLRPDLTVGMSFKPTGKSVTFTVFNKCKGKAPASKVQIKATKDDGNGFYYMTADVPPLAGGAKTEVTFWLQPGYPVKTFSQR